MFGGSGVIAGKKNTIIVDAQNRSDQADLILELMQLNRFEIEWLLPGHGGIVHDGNKKITEAADELRRLPDRVLSLLNEKASTSLQISDTLLVWPNTVEVALRKLEKDGRVRKVEEKTSVTSGRWMIS